MCSSDLSGIPAVPYIPPWVFQAKQPGTPFRCRMTAATISRSSIQRADAPCRKNRIYREIYTLYIFFFYFYPFPPSGSYAQGIREPRFSRSSRPRQRSIRLHTSLHISHAFPYPAFGELIPPTHNLRIPGFQLLVEIRLRHRLHARIAAVFLVP